MTRRAWILRFLLEDAMLRVLVPLVLLKRARPRTYKPTKPLTWPIGTPWWRKPVEEKE